jgi:peptide/nickel transport system substrate-binding protein
VDTDGNQLPYIGTLQYATVTNIDVAALSAANGDYDFQEVIFGVDKLPVLYDFQQRGAYQVSLDPEQAGIGIALNLAYDEDPEIGEWLRNVDFRRALSMGVDRSQLNETFFLGTGTPSSAAPTDDNNFFPGKEWRTKWATLDLAQANQLLDKIGLTQKDSDGYRLRKDGKGRLQLTFAGVVRLGIDGAQFGEMVRRHWQKIGIDVFVDSIASSLAQQRLAANQLQMVVNTASTEDVYLFTGTLTPVTNGYTRIMGLPYAQWVNTGGQQGKQPFPALKEAIDLLEKGKTQTDAERIETGKELFRRAIDNVFNIGVIVGDLNAGVRIAKTVVGNVPERIVNSNVLLSPTNLYAQTMYFK